MEDFNVYEGIMDGLREAVAAIPAGGPSISDLANLNRYVTTLITHIKIEDKKLSAFLRQAYNVSAHQNGI